MDRSTWQIIGPERGRIERCALLEAELQGFLSARTVIVGIGNAARGDDGIGPTVIYLLRGRSTLPLVDAGAYPENHLGTVIEYGPDSVLLIDAAETGAAPGAIVCCEPRVIAGGGISTHCGSLGLLADYIAFMSQATCRLLLVQPADLDGDPTIPADHGDLPDHIRTLSPSLQVAAYIIGEAILSAERDVVSSPGGATHGA